MIWQENAIYWEKEYEKKRQKEREIKREKEKKMFEELKLLNQQFDEGPTA